MLACWRHAFYTIEGFCFVAKLCQAPSCCRSWQITHVPLFFPKRALSGLQLDLFKNWELNLYVLYHMSAQPCKFLGELFALACWWPSAAAGQISRIFNQTILICRCQSQVPDVLWFGNLLTSENNWHLNCLNSQIQKAQAKIWHLLLIPPGSI